MAQLETFRGNLQWIHRWEGHCGKPYWPGGVSGVTLDAGFDLGYADPDLFEEVYSEVLTDLERSACKRFMGITGSAARQVVNEEPSIRSIRISEEEAAGVFPHVVDSYWDQIVDRFPALLDEEVPSAVHTAFLSLSVNRGPGNSAFSSIRGPLQNHNWEELSARIMGMQDSHPLDGIQVRRDEEGELIQKAANRRHKKLLAIGDSVRELELAPLESIPTDSLSQNIQDLELQ